MPTAVELNQNGVLQGSLGGRLVTCVLQPGVTIPKGQYMLLPAVNDPIYGTLVRMVPVGEEGLSTASVRQRIESATSAGSAWSVKSVAPTFMKLTPASSTAGDTVGRFKDSERFKFDPENPKAGADAVGRFKGEFVMDRAGGTPLESNTGGFVLSAKAMPGRNNLVVNFGFSDLVDGLKMGGWIVQVT